MRAAVVSSSPTAITDPLTAGHADRPATARGRLRRTGAWLFAAAAVTQLLVLLAPDPNPSDHGGLVGVVAACALLALVLFLWRRPPGLLLHLICPLGTIITSAAVAVAEPVALTSMFYLLPLTLAAYFLDRRAVIANLALAAAAYGLALSVWVDPVLRVASFVAVLSVVIVVCGVIVALTERVGGLMQRLEALATYDPLTGALNRHSITERLDAELARVARTGAVCAIAMIDIDHFKSLNDARGHAAGDEALRLFGGVVDEGKRRADVFGRVGGEEFLLILVDTDADGAATFGDHLRARLAAAGSPVTVSIGVTDTAGSGHSAETLLSDADRALYTAKRTGRDRVSRAPRPASPVAAVA
jgi:diguanylate cyclase (GGDEF)-like protein